ncbi:MAG: tRNA (adenosine(37)-N6)-threonylcarbamoyltransferase complex dimerization subunit type 1 TsaB [Zavarzinia sp.]|nr:tRNA (adenosine(37)-N6)-threonylcarbamoyltransferase complex dimerization subunit type 1 TsaB [Zavarzinia sp.]
MNVLAFDCATGPTSVAVRRDGELAARADDARPQGQAESLVPLIGAVLQQAGIAPAALDRIAVTLGPGSFTGVRIAIAAARGLALALGRPVFGYSSLDVMAAALPPSDLPTLVAIDARRGEAYVRLFAADGPALTPPFALPLDDAAARLPGGDLRLAGSGAPLVATRLGDRARVVLPDVVPDAAVLALMAEGAAPEHGLITPEPLYLRPPDAKLPGA